MRLRKVLFVTFLALAVPVGTASLAYACTALATLTVTSGAAAPGQTISGTGKGFNGGLHGADPLTATRTPVVMRLNSRSGPILGSFVPINTAGDLVFSFTAPNVPAGQHVLIGVQNDPATGNPYYGTPARQSITIAAAAARADASRADGVSAPVAADQAATAPATKATPAPPVPAPAAAAAASANATRPSQTAGAAAAGSAAAASSAPVQAGQAATGAPAAPVSGIQSTLASDLGARSATPAAAAAASGAAAVTTTATPDLVVSSDTDGGSVLPGMLLMLLGLGIGLTASARWLVGRLPMLRRTVAA